MTDTWGPRRAFKRGVKHRLALRQASVAEGHSVAKLAQLWGITEAGVVDYMRRHGLAEDEA